jgi:hypothetical protein
MLGPPKLHPLDNPEPTRQSARHATTYRLTAPPPPAAAALAAVAFSRQLRQAHQHLRDQLGGIRAELGRNQHVETELHAHCLAFCSALTAHHVGEDDGMFKELLDAQPDLAPKIQNLIDDHATIAVILLQVRALAIQAETTPAESLPRLRRELDGLAAIAESHFGYEERAISAALHNDVPAR